MGGPLSQYEPEQNPFPRRPKANFDFISGVLAYTEHGTLRLR